MGRRSRFGAGLLKLAIWPAIVLLAAGASATITGVAQHEVHAPSGLHSSVFQLPPQFEVRPSCPVITFSTAGACPLPAIPAQAWSNRANIFLCSASLCGGGFHPGDTILVLATRTEGMTFWHTEADRAGNFRSALPAPLCRFAPVGLTAFDAHDVRSNRLSLASTGC